MKTAYATNDDIRMMPNSPELEAAVLGALLVDEQAIHQVSTILSPEHFYNNSNKAVYSAIEGLYRGGQGIDTPLVLEWLKGAKECKIETPFEYLSNLCINVGSTANVESQALIIRQYAMIRRAITGAQTAIRKAYDGADAFDVVNELIDLAGLVSGDLTALQETKIYDLASDTYLKIQQMRENKTNITGISSPIRALDAHTGGWQSPDMVVIAARPGMGKTAFALELARNAAIKGHSVGFVTLEMGGDQLMQRFFAAHAGIELGNVRNGKITDAENEKLGNAAAEISGLKLQINKPGRVSLNDVVAMAKSWKAKHRIEMLIVDYLQLIRVDGETNSERETSIISGRLKQLAMELGIPVIVLSQLSRAVETRGGDKRPMLSDLRHSGAIEQDADMVIFPFREDYYTDEAEAGKMELIIAKYRNGRACVIDCSFDLATQRFSDINY